MGFEELFCITGLLNVSDIFNEMYVQNICTTVIAKPTPLHSMLEYEREIKTKDKDTGEDKGRQ